MITKLTEEAQILHLYQRLLDGWNVGSGILFAAPFSEDADFIAFDGRQFKGRQEIATAHQQLFDSFLSKSRLLGKVRSVRFLTPEVALMIAVGGTTMAGQDLESERLSIQLLVAGKHDLEWRLEAFHNSQVHTLGGTEIAEALTEELQELLLS